MLIVLTMTSRSETQSKNTTNHHIIGSRRLLSNVMWFFTTPNFGLPYDTMMITA